MAAESGAEAVELYTKLIEARIRLAMEILHVIRDLAEIIGGRGSLEREQAKALKEERKLDHKKGKIGEDRLRKLAQIRNTNVVQKDAYISHSDRKKIIAKCKERGVVCAVYAEVKNKAEIKDCQRRINELELDPKAMEAKEKLLEQLHSIENDLHRDINSAKKYLNGVGSREALADPENDPYLKELDAGIKDAKEKIESISAQIESRSYLSPENQAEFNRLNDRLEMLEKTNGSAKIRYLESDSEVMQQIFDEVNRENTIETLKNNINMLESKGELSEKEAALKAGLDRTLYDYENLEIQSFNDFSIDEELKRALSGQENTFAKNSFEQAMNRAEVLAEPGKDVIVADENDPSKYIVVKAEYEEDGGKSISYEAYSDGQQMDTNGLNIQSTVANIEDPENSDSIKDYRSAVYDKLAELNGMDTSAARLCKDEMELNALRQVTTDINEKWNLDIDKTGISMDTYISGNIEMLPESLKDDLKEVKALPCNTSINELKAEMEKNGYSYDETRATLTNMSTGEVKPVKDIKEVSHTDPELSIAIINVKAIKEFRELNELQKDISDTSDKVIEDSEKLIAATSEWPVDEQNKLFEAIEEGKIPPEMEAKMDDDLKGLAEKYKTDAGQMKEKMDAHKEKKESIRSRLGANNRCKIRMVESAHDNRGEYSRGYGHGNMTMAQSIQKLKEAQKEKQTGQAANLEAKRRRDNIVHSGKEL